ncbi:hypothetical protein R1flu_014753 [Riccia fluitans]|uniref:Lipid-A-disaccharide synthase n=1 Tax=Riccia fluitans TaxID=41844 RepID=A0ABD1YKT0_9MARC
MDLLKGSSGAVLSSSRRSLVLVDIDRNLHISQRRVIHVSTFRNISGLWNHGGHLEHKGWRTTKGVRKCTPSRMSVISCSAPPTKEEAQTDVVLLSNGPGEVATWVKPVLDSLRRQSENTCIRISVVLQPCPHASGREVELVESYKQVDRCLGPEYFWKLVLFGTTENDWTWNRRGVCVFLGGDQFYTLLLSQRLGYKSIIYSEDSIRWPGLVDMYMLRSAKMLSGVPFWAHSKCRVVGDLFSDSVFGLQPQRKELHTFKGADSPEEAVPVVGFLPGSKPSKLALGVPYFMAVANHLHRLTIGRIRFMLPLAPTATLNMIEKYAAKSSNPNILEFSWASGKVVLNDESLITMDHKDERKSDAVVSELNVVGHLVTDEAVSIEILQQFPAYGVFSRFNLCITTIGTNTAELGYLGIPMLVVLPTHALEVFKGGTGGLLGLLANVPGAVGNSVARNVNSALLSSSGYLAWPNRWVNREIVPELVGRIEPVDVANIAIYYLGNEERLKEMREQLLRIQARHREPSAPGVDEKNGAAEAVATEVFRLLAI